MSQEEKTSQASKNGINTRLAHIGHDPSDYFGFVNPPVVHASTVLFPDYDTMKNRSQKYLYGTRGTPTTDALCQALDELEGSAGTVLVPSGLVAISLPLLAFLSAGDHCLVVDSVYSPTRNFCNTVLTRMGIDVEYFDPDLSTRLSEKIKPNTKVIFLEAPASNTFEMIDIPAIVDAIGEKDIITMMDNTWATPLLYKPLDHGIDISIHALTKYPAGHSDLVMGSVSANEKCWKQLLSTHGAMGLCGNGDDAYLVLRGLRTMGIRLERVAKSAMEIAKWLEERNDISRVLYPALTSDPGYGIWKRDFCGASGLLGFVIRDASLEAGAKFIDALQLIGRGYSWAGHESLCVLPDLSDRTITKTPSDGMLVRLQVGLEDVPDLILDLEQALDAVGT